MQLRRTRQGPQGRHVYGTGIRYVIKWRLMTIIVRLRHPQAKTLCPDLIVLPYNFEAIEAVSCQIYRLFFRFTPAVHAVSCDEAFLEFPTVTNGVAKAEEIRTAIFTATKCAASVGVSSNLLLARYPSICTTVPWWI